MIEFDGYISGISEKWCYKRNWFFGMKMFWIALLLVSPTILYLGVKINNWAIIGLYGSLFVITPLLSLVSQSKKSRKMTTPKRVFTDGEIITCVTDKNVETRYIQDVKFVNDYGEFYELVFPFGKISKNFICQKSLLVGGTLEDFEMLFKKSGVSIIRKKNTEDDTLC